MGCSESPRSLLGISTNDGWIDLCVIAGGVPLLFENDHGVFKKRDLPASGTFTLAVWLDYDHDYDLDLMLLDRNRCFCGIKERPDGRTTQRIFRSSTQSRLEPSHFA